MHKVISVCAVSILGLVILPDLALAKKKHHHIKHHHHLPQHVPHMHGGHHGHGHGHLRCHNITLMENGTAAVHRVCH